MNSSPSLATDALLDKKIKYALVTDMFNILGVCTYNRAKGMRFTCVTGTKVQILTQKARAKVKALRQEAEGGSRVTPSAVCGGGGGGGVDKVGGVTDKVPAAERIRRVEVCRGRVSALENLSALPAADVEVLRESEEELHLCGGFARVYPSASADVYTPLFVTRYYNQLLLQFVQRYGAARVDDVLTCATTPPTPLPPAWPKPAALPHPRDKKEKKQTAGDPARTTRGHAGAASARSTSSQSRPQLRAAYREVGGEPRSPARGPLNTGSQGEGDKGDALKKGDALLRMTSKPQRAKSQTARAHTETGGGVTGGGEVWRGRRRMSEASRPREACQHVGGGSASPFASPYLFKVEPLHPAPGDVKEFRGRGLSFDLSRGGGGHALGGGGLGMSSWGGSMMSEERREKGSGYKRGDARNSLHSLHDLDCLDSVAARALAARNVPAHFGVSSIGPPLPRFQVATAFTRGCIEP